MDECSICYESPCTCVASKPVRKPSGVRASRRSTTESTPQPVGRKDVRKFSSAPARVAAKLDDTDEPGITEESGADEDQVLLAAIQCFAPLLSPREWARHMGASPKPVSLSLEERRAKFRSEVGEWSEARYA